LQQLAKTQQTKHSESTTSALQSQTMSSLDNFQDILRSLFRRGGGRRPTAPSQPSQDVHGDGVATYLQPASPHAARLTIVQITDVYTLDNFPHIKTMLQELRTHQTANDTSNKVVSMVSEWNRKR
jgi:hypothetical protein